MYDTFKEKEQYSLLMDRIKLQNIEYMQYIRESGKYLNKAQMREKVKYAITHMDREMAKNYIKGKITDKIVAKKQWESKIQNHENMAAIKPNYFSKSRIAVYTVMFGGYDRVHEPVVIPDNVDFYIITDMDQLPDNSVWKKFDDANVKKYTNDLDTGIRNRWYKTHPHILFSECDYSLYVDSSIKIITDVTEHINKIGQSGMAIHRHPGRDCVYDELDAVRCYRRDNSKNLLRVEEWYLGMKFPKHYGLLETTITARRHNDENVISIMEDWWNYIENYSRRDQLSLPVVLYQHDIKIDDVCGLGNNIRENPAFRWESHKSHYERVKNRKAK